MNELSITSKNEGLEVVSEEKSIFFPNAELLNVGCKNCIWKLHSQCPYGLENEEIYPKDISTTDKKNLYDDIELGTMLEGICQEVIQFLSTLAEKNDTLTAVWEKFHIYKARLQESVDYADFINLQKEIKEREKELKKGLFTEADYELLDKLKMDRNAAKLWWARLNQHVIQSMQKVVDREAKKSETPKLAGIHSSGTINFNITKEIKQLEEK